MNKIKNCEEFFLKYDLYRYFYPNEHINEVSYWKKVKIVLLTQGIWATTVYRIGSWCIRNRTRLGSAPRAVLPILTIIQKIVEITTGIKIPFSTKIGRGLYICHFGEIIFSPKVVLGEFCNISQGVTIGEAGRSFEQYAPIIGDRVYIAPGAKIFGRITIGNDVAIGANAVVTVDLPDKAVAVGVPAKIINFNSSKDFINFNRHRMGLE